MASSISSVKFVCKGCGYRALKWMGRCPNCEQWDTLAEEAADIKTARRSAPARSVAFPDIETELTERIQTGNPEFDRVLGGGLVPASLILLGGEPGIGKSTLLLQIAERLSRKGLAVLYVAGEESNHQVRLRGERLGLRGDKLRLITSTDVGSVIATAQEELPGLLIVDSIQTLHSDKLESIPGSIGQIRECASQLMQFVKRSGIPAILIGHVTKEGSLAGPKTLEHAVDVVLYFEGDRHQNQKIIRATKNRFGPANELGVFEMTSRGLRAVDNPSKLFLAERMEGVSGSVVVCTMEGSRPVLAEIQALVSHTTYGTARRMTNGVDPNRVSLLLAMLEKRIGLQLIGCDVYVNVVGGLSPSEPAVDLAIVAAIFSSFRELPIPGDVVVFGELGLAGEVRPVGMATERIREANALGFRQALLPIGNLPLSEMFGELKTVGVGSVTDFVAQLDRLSRKELE